MSVDATIRRELFAAGRSIWAEFEARTELYHPFVPTDYDAAHDALVALAERGHAGASFLELGSGNGVVTILAGLLGFDAAGVELDPWLARRAEALAARFGVDVRFARGSWVPADFPLDELADELAVDDFIVTGDGEPAYDELGRELEDFDVIYLFPWPDERPLWLEMLRRHARPDAVVLTFDATDGFEMLTNGAD